MANSRYFPEAFRNAGPLVGAVPAGYQLGVDTANGKIYYNNGGVWALANPPIQPIEYVGGVKNANQAIPASVETDVSFQTVYSNGIVFNAGPSTITLLAGGVYRISGQARMINLAAAATMQMQFKTDPGNGLLYVLNPAGFSSTAAINGTDGPTVDFMYSPLVNTDIKMRINSSQAGDISAEGTFFRVRRMA